MTEEQVRKIAREEAIKVADEIFIDYVKTMDLKHRIEELDKEEK